MLTTTKANKIDLDQISDIEVINDYQAEILSAGALRWSTGYEEGVSQEASSFNNIRLAFEYLRKLHERTIRRRHS